MLHFKKFETQDKVLIDTWFKSDELGMRFLSSYITDNFLHLIDFRKRYLWVVTNNNLPIGFFDFEIETEERGYFSFYISPEYRGKGVGFDLLKEALKLPETVSVKILEGGVEKDNLPSIKTLEKAGFKYVETDEDGMLTYQLSI